MSALQMSREARSGHESPTVGYERAASLSAEKILDAAAKVAQSHGLETRNTARRRPTSSVGHFGDGQAEILRSDCYGLAWPPRHRVSDGERARRVSPGDCAAA